MPAPLPTRRPGPLRPSAAVAAALAAVLLAPALASASTRLASTTPTLTVSGSRSAEGLITLTRASAIDITGTSESSQVSVTGGGRVAGVLLQSLDADNPIAVTAVTFNACGSPGCKPVQSLEYVAGPAGPVNDDGSRRVTLPAGDYRVVVIADGADVTAKLTLGGLSGPVTLRPSKPYPVRLRDVKDSTGTAVAPATPAFSGGYAYDTTVPTVVLFQELYRTAAAAATVPGTCIVYGPPPPLDLYGPGCLTADNGDNREQFITPVSVPATQQVLVVGYGATALPAQNISSVGHYMLSAAPVIKSVVTQIDVPLLPRAATADASGTG